MRKLIYVMVAFFLVGCSSDTIDVQNLERNNGKGKGKKEKVLHFAIPNEPTNTTFAIGRIAEYGGTYLGELPNNYGQVDWDNDGTLDDVTLVGDEFLVNGVVVCNTLQTAYDINGFTDVDGDGYQDIIVSYGDLNCYNTVTPPADWVSGAAYNIGDKVRYYPGGCCLITYYCLEAHTGSTINPEDDSRWRRAYNVLYNREGEYPTPIADLLESLVIVSTPQGNGLDRITWDIGEEYQCFNFHVWYIVNGVPFAQTNSYGEFGITINNNYVNEIPEAIWFDQYDVYKFLE